MTKVFVYGTLLRDDYNHRHLDGARFICEAMTPPCFELRHLGGFPAMLERGSTSVVGEVYEVDDDILRRLDRLEGHPRFYHRAWIDLSDGERVLTYVMTPARAGDSPIIESGSWRDAVADGRR